MGFFVGDLGRVSSVVNAERCLGILRLRISMRKRAVMISSRSLLRRCALDYPVTDDGDANPTRPIDQAAHRGGKERETCRAEV